MVCVPGQSTTRSLAPTVNACRLKSFRRRCREQRLQERYQSMLTTDDEAMSELKQGRYWTREQRKEHLARAKQVRQRAKEMQQHPLKPYSDSATDDFNLLNRIFLRENQRELKAKPCLAHRYVKQSSIERNKLKQLIAQHHLKRIQCQSTTTTLSLVSTMDQSSLVVL